MTSRNSTRRVNTAGLIMALVFAAVAAIGVAGSTWWVTISALPWAIAGVVALVGIAMVLSALPRRGPRRR